MAFPVLRDLGISIGRQVAHDNRYLMKPGSNCRAQPLGAEVDAVPAIAIGRMHDERLQDAALPDVRSGLCKRVLGELGARVVRIFVEQRHGYQHRSAVVAAELG